MQKRSNPPKRLPTLAAAAVTGFRAWETAIRAKLDKRTADQLRLRDLRDIYLRPGGTPTPDQAAEELRRYHYNSLPVAERIKGRR